MGDKPYVVKSHDIHLDSDYRDWIAEIKQRYQSSQIKAAVKVNSEALLFNWQLGRDLVTRKAEEKWGKGVVEQVSLDLQAAFPGAKGFSARNLWWMKQWYVFYSSESAARQYLEELENKISSEGQKLNQLGSEIRETKLSQPGSEIAFPPAFAYVPWRHHVLIIQKCKSIDEALFYIRKTIEKSWSRSALDDNIRADLFHVSGGALTNFRERLPIPRGSFAQELLKNSRRILVFSNMSQPAGSSACFFILCSQGIFHMSVQWAQSPLSFSYSAGLRGRSYTGTAGIDSCA